ncbi:MAG: flavodoxin domain-containing protein, partial [Lachnospiraceae bacterium]|nr:flavodoxin domain-containing protein [Lachnospiraceae bacterium]
MDKVYVVYWSQSGNTQAMAEAVGKGASDAGKEANVLFVSDASVNDLAGVKGFALGCPAMGAEVLEEDEMEPFISSAEGIANEKTIVLFGSYGWG